MSVYVCVYTRMEGLVGGGMVYSLRLDLRTPLADWLVYMWFVYVYANAYPLCISFSSLSHMGKRKTGMFRGRQKGG